MAATVLNEAQLELLRTEEEIDRLWEDGTLTEAKVESFRSLHERTAYK